MPNRTPLIRRGLVAAAALLAPMLVACQPAASTPPLYGWDGSTQGWGAENATASVADSPRLEGSGALRLSRSAPSGWASLRAYDGSTEVTDPSVAGRQLSVWALVPAGTPGTGWAVRLQVQDASWTWHMSPAQPVTVGQWTEVRWTIPSGVTSMRRLGVQAEVTNGSGAVAVHLDAFRRSAGTSTSSSTSTTAAPSTTTSTTTASTPSGTWPTGADPLQRRTLADLRKFTDWLRQGGAKGWIGEVGWPNDESADRWNALADTWYRAADAEGLWVTAWATGEWWGPYELGIYGAGTSVDRPMAQASVVERHLGATGPDRGVNVNGGEFGIGCNLGTGSGCAFSNTNPGTYDQAYHYDSQATFTYLRSRGVEVVRIPFRWERIQRSLNGPLDTAELARLRGVVDRAEAAGLKVIPSIMNYGAYWLGSGGTGQRTAIGTSQVPVSAYADLWRRLATAFTGEPAVLGWGLMNEPTNMPGGPATWEQASQAAVDAIRAAGDTRTVLVPTYQWSTVIHAPTQHPNGPWIRDPRSAVRYEAHHYFDTGYSGDYARTYDQEVAVARSEGW